jgi:predicted amidohydrolase
MTARDALTAAVKGGARNLGRDDIGEIAPGFAADFVGFRTDSIAFAGAQRDVVCALIFCSPGADQVPEPCQLEHAAAALKQLRQFESCGEEAAHRQVP